MSRKRHTRKRYGSKACVYCGSREEVEEEHVVPKCLFDPQPPNHIKLPGCKACNRKKAEYDSILRDFLVNIPGNDHPVALRLKEGKSAPSIWRNQSAFVRKILSRGDFERFRAYRLTPSGILTRMMTRAPVSLSEDGITAALVWIVRGLFWRISGTRAPADAEVKSCYLPAGQVQQRYRELDNLKPPGSDDPPGHIFIGDVFCGVFRWTLSGSSVWLLEFYGRVQFFVGLFPRKHDDPIPDDPTGEI